MHRPFGLSTHQLPAKVVFAIILVTSTMTGLIVRAETCLGINDKILYRDVDPWYEP